MSMGTYRTEKYLPTLTRTINAYHHQYQAISSIGNCSKHIARANQPTTTNTDALLPPYHTIQCNMVLMNWKRAKYKTTHDELRICRTWKGLINFYISSHFYSLPLPFLPSSSLSLSLLRLLPCSGYCNIESFETRWMVHGSNGIVYVCPIGHYSSQYSAKISLKSNISFGIITTKWINSVGWWWAAGVVHSFLISKNLF